MPRRTLVQNEPAFAFARENNGQGDLERLEGVRLTLDKLRDSRFRSIPFARQSLRLRAQAEILSAQRPTRRRWLLNGKANDALAAKAATGVERAWPRDRRARALARKARETRVSCTHRGLQARATRARVAIAITERTCGNAFPMKCSEPHSGTDATEPAIRTRAYVELAVRLHQHGRNRERRHR